MQLQTGPEKQHPRKHNVVTRVTANRYKEMITTVHIVQCGDAVVHRPLAFTSCGDGAQCAFDI